MKHIIVLILMAVFLIPALSCAGVIAPARVLLAEGEVLFRAPDADEWLPVTVNTPLDEGDAIWAPDGSRTELQLSDGTVIRLDGGSELDLIAVEEGFTHLHMAGGRLYLRTSRNTGMNSLQIDADDTTVLPDARTRLRIDMLPNNQEDVAIFKGSAYVEGNGARTRVRSGEHIALEESHSELLPLDPPDAWENWNIARDRSQARSATADAYLPEELRPYSGDLESYGSWVQAPEYGMVWRPTVLLSQEWAPYRSGRWIWKQGDYVWISYESWGWLPYHYGRWTVVSGFGWCWVPPARDDIYWGPGYVGWFRNGNHVGWTPLAPGETFYGRRYYGRHSVTTAPGAVTSATAAYRNRDVRGGFSVLLQSDFLRGRNAYQKPAAIRSISLSFSPGSPTIQPVRETRMPITRQMTPRVAAPVNRHRDNRELRARFPRLIPEAEKQRPPQRQVATPVPAGVPAVPSASGRNGSGNIRTMQPQQSTNRPERKEQPPLTPQTERRALPAPGTSGGRGETAVRGSRPGELKLKKVWRVKTKEQGSEKELKEGERKEHKGR